MAEMLRKQLEPGIRTVAAHKGSPTLTDRDVDMVVASYNEAQVHGEDPDIWAMVALQECSDRQPLLAKEKETYFPAWGYNTSRQETVEVVHTETEIVIDGVSYNPSVLISAGVAWVKYAKEHKWRFLDASMREIHKEHTLRDWSESIKNAIE